MSLFTRMLIVNVGMLTFNVEVLTPGFILYQISSDGIPPEVEKASKHICT